MRISRNGVVRPDEGQGARPHFDETGMNGRAVTKVVPYMMAVRLRKSRQKELHEKLLSGRWSHL